MNSLVEEEQGAGVDPRQPGSGGRGAEEGEQAEAGKDLETETLVNAMTLF